MSIRRTAQRYALRSEASLRFEKGQESRLARLGADRVAQLVSRWSEGRARVAVGRVDTSPVEPGPARLPFRPARVCHLLGTPIAAGEIRELLRRVEVATDLARPGDAVPVAPGSPPRVLDAAEAQDALVAIVPTHRRDLEIEADIAEEVARVYGYDRIPGRLPETPMPDFRPDPRRVVDAVRDMLAGRGLDEVVTNALVSPLDHERLGIRGDDPATIRVTNPIAADHSQLRRSLLPGLVRVLVENERQRRGDLAVFEVGRVHRLVDAGPLEELMLGILVAGDQAPAAWNEPPRTADIWEARGLVDVVCSRLGVPPAVGVPAAGPGRFAHPGRAAVLEVPSGAERIVLGDVFEVHPRYLEETGARAAHVAVALIFLAPLQALVAPSRRYVAFPRVPAAERDLAVVLGTGHVAGEVEAVIRDAAHPLLRRLRLFDVYRGAPLEPGERSLAFRLTLQAPGRTLTDAEIDAAVANVVEALAVRLGVRIRA